MTASNETQCINGRNVTPTQSTTLPLLIHQFSHGRHQVKLSQCPPDHSPCRSPSSTYIDPAALAQPASQSLTRALALDLSSAAM
ncbi:hypothetical protein BCR44DRAFT_1429213 [Catenaria anguillulae PL171]|uniref:Uncharacterized protein n=1 Tax=Catenaria anguillulae PL171 TaxID=765915 RepID=A0A1Y2HVC4_9FUNG|nr:hypothetical protein BCR44DRAFT_1429213 [Catenaria anguillulae PL171]